MKSGLRRVDRERRDKNQKLCVLFGLYAVKYPKMKLIPIQVECYAGTKKHSTFNSQQPYAAVNASRLSRHPEDGDACK